MYLGGVAVVARCLVRYGSTSQDECVWGYQWRPKHSHTYLPLAHDVKKALGDKLVVGLVGGITDGHIMQDVLQKGQADVALPVES
jgi:hypothetical protein